MQGYVSLRESLGNPSNENQENGTRLGWAKSLCTLSQWREGTGHSLTSYYQDNKETIDARHKKWDKANPEIMKASGNKWRKSNPDKVRAIRQKRRARIVGNGGSFTDKEWLWGLVKRTGNKCLCCGVSGKKVTLHSDHVISLVNGGAGDINNMQPLCKPCNSSKGTKNTDYR